MLCLIFFLRTKLVLEAPITDTFLSFDNNSQWRVLDGYDAVETTNHLNTRSWCRCFPTTLGLDDNNALKALHIKTFTPRFSFACLFYWILEWPRILCKRRCCSNASFSLVSLLLWSSSSFAGSLITWWTCQRAYIYTWALWVIESHQGVSQTSNRVKEFCIWTDLVLGLNFGSSNS